MRGGMTKEDMRKKNHINSARKNLKAELEKMAKNGAELFVDGKAVKPGEAASKAVCENSPYMADYVFGETGNIKQIRFDKIMNY